MKYFYKVIDFQTLYLIGIASSTMAHTWSINPSTARRKWRLCGFCRSITKFNNWSVIFKWSSLTHIIINI